MKAFVDAIVQRFKTDKTLLRYARRIYEDLGDEPTKSVPYVNLAIEGPSSELDSFDADFNEFEVTFTIFGKDSLSDSVHSALEAMTQVFDDCSLVSAEFETVQFKRTGGSQPSVVDGRFQASLTYTAIIQMTRLVPVEREA